MISVNNRLTDIVINNGLFKSGHYRLDEKYSVRDWIDLDGLFEYEMRTHIYDIISEPDVKEIIESQKTIIGINHYGAILASLIGYRYKKPFAYIFDSNKVVDTFEREINNIEKGGILLVIDVIVFGDSLCKVLEAMHKKGMVDVDDRIDVLILFERINRSHSKNKKRYNLSKIYSSNLIHKIYVMNDSFEVELCNKDRNNCIFRKGKSKDNCERERNK